MNKPKVYIDGKEGTTGLQIYERLGNRDDIELLLIDEDKRKDTEERRKFLNAADLVFLCLPDDAAREAVSMIDNPDTVVIDASTAHRTLEGWCYGLPELSSERAEQLKTAKRIAVPGCHASGFIALVPPLIRAGYLPTDALLTCTSLWGYSGGGKKMIAEYEAGEDALLGAPRQYGLTQQHKHLKEMKAITGLETTPAFLPIVADFYSGMEVTVPLFASQLKDGVGIDEIRALYKECYRTDLLYYAEESDEAGFLSAAAMSGKDSMQVSVFGNEERILLVARYDNLGKGASGAAIECLNTVLGVEPTLGLVL